MSDDPAAFLMLCFLGTVVLVCGGAIGWCLGRSVGVEATQMEAVGYGAAEYVIGEHKAVEFRWKGQKAEKEPKP